MNRLKHIRAVSHDPVDLKFLNKIILFIMFGTVILVFQQLLQN